MRRLRRLPCHPRRGIDCALENKLYKKGRCARCSLHRQATELLTGPSRAGLARLSGLLEVICVTRTPRSALNWLCQGAACAVFTEIASGRLQIPHEALDTYPHPRAANYLAVVNGLMVTGPVASISP